MLHHGSINHNLLSTIDLVELNWFLDFYALKYIETRLQKETALKPHVPILC